MAGCHLRERRHSGAVRFPVIWQLQAHWRIAGAISEQRLAAGRGNTPTPERRPGGRTDVERCLDGSGDELRGLGVDSDVPAEQHAADNLAHVPGRVLRVSIHVSAPS
jgi:hypothetical protein